MMATVVSVCATALGLWVGIQWGDTMYSLTATLLHAHVPQKLLCMHHYSN